MGVKLTRSELDRRMEAVKMQREGCGHTEIAQAMGVTYSQVSAWFRGLGYDPVTYHMETMCAMYIEGASLTEIMHTTGVSVTYRDARDRLKTELERRGISWRTHGETKAAGEKWQRRKDHLVCNECSILLDAPTKTGVCDWCKERIETGRIPMMPREVDLIAEAMAVRA